MSTSYRPPATRTFGSLRAACAAFAALLLAIFLTSGTVAPASATGPSTGSVTWTSYVGEQDPSGAIQGMKFLPGAIWIHTGDTVRWVSESAEPHTVSFINASHPAVPFSPAIPYMVTRTAQGSISAPGQFRNSGVLSTIHDPEFPTSYLSYSLRFTAPGVYHYLCYVHGAMMSGDVVVQSGGPLPFTQAHYNAQFRQGRAAVILQGTSLWNMTRAKATNHHVYLGASNMGVMLMRFVRPTVYVDAGDWVTFDTNLNMSAVPHTVTIGQPPANPAMPVGNPATLRLGQRLNSGILFPAMFHVPGTRSTFSVRFLQPGTYHYYCMFHDSLGMDGTVVVSP